VTTIETAWLFLRILGAGSLVFLGPGLLAVGRLGLSVAWPERVVLAFAFSFAWVFALAVLLPLAHLTIAHAGLITLGLAVVLVAGRARLVSLKSVGAAFQGFHSDHWIALALGISFAILGWVLEATITGEEALDLVSASRIADGGRLTLDNASLMPDTRYVYLFQPYPLAIAAISRMSGTDPLVTLVKLRTVLAPLCVALLYALSRRLTTVPSDAKAVLAAVLVFVYLDVPTWEFNSLLPLVRRGGFAAGIAVPALMSLCVLATRTAVDGGGVRLRRTAGAGAAALLLASLSTHPLEMFPLLLFAGAVAFSVVAGFDRAGSRKAALGLMAALAVVAVVFRLVQANGVPLVAEYESPRQAGHLRALVDLLSNPTAFFAGPMHPQGTELLARRIPSTTTGTIGVPALVLAVWASPFAAAWLALALVPLLAAFATPGGYLTVAFATSDATVTDINAYFALLGAMAVSLAALSVARYSLRMAGAVKRSWATARATTAACLVLALAAWLLSGQVSLWLLSLAQSRPRLVAGLAVPVALAVLFVARTQAHRLSTAPTPVRGTILLTMALVVPSAYLGRSFGGVFDSQARVALPTALARAWELPSVLDWGPYYERVRTTIAPPVPVPRAVVDALRERLPPRTVLLADPRYSCGLAVFLDAYCINPERIYGHFFLSARHYFDAYVQAEADSPAWHPWFNTTWPYREAEREVLRAAGVDAILAAPEHASLIGRKLQAMIVPSPGQPLPDGYMLYALRRR